MMPNDVKDYMQNLFNTSGFDALDADDKDKVIFTAMEMLKDFYYEHEITPRAVALQTLYVLEGESEEFEMLKRHGIKSYAVKGVSVTFDGSMISPAVIQILGKRSQAFVGRLI